MFTLRAEWLQNGAIVARESTSLEDRESFLRLLKSKVNMMRDASPRHSPDSVRVFDANGVQLGTFRV